MNDVTDELIEDFKKLPDDMKDIAVLYWENIRLGKEKENEIIFEKVKKLAEGNNVKNTRRVNDGTKNSR